MVKCVDCGDEMERDFRNLYCTDCDPVEGGEDDG